MDSVIGLLFSNHDKFQTISERCSCVVGASHSIGLEIVVASRRSHEFLIHCSSHKQETPICLKSIIKIYMSIIEPFIKLIGGSFVLPKWGYKANDCL